MIRVSCLIFIFSIFVTCVRRTPLMIKKMGVWTKKKNLKKMLHLLFDIIIPVEDFHGFTFKTKKSKAVPARAHKPSG